MKSIKDLRESYNLITEKEEHDMNKLTQLVRAGLFDAKKLSVLKRAMEKPADKMTAQEKRMLLNLLDSLISQVTSDEQVYRKVKQNVHSVNEAKRDDVYSKFDTRVKQGFPTDRDIPSVLILKRKAIRVYPDNQKVALYYSQALDKYVTIPFSDIQLGLNEAKKNNDDENKDYRRINKTLNKPNKTKNIETYRRIANIFKTGKTSAPLSDTLSAATRDYNYFRNTGSSRAVSLGAAIHDAIGRKFRQSSLERAISKRNEKQRTKALKISKIEKWRQSSKNKDLSQNVPPKPSASTEGNFTGKLRATAMKQVTENYKIKLQELREARQINENPLAAVLPLVAGAARVVGPSIARAAGPVIAGATRIAGKGKNLLSKAMRRARRGIRNRLAGTGGDGDSRSSSTSNPQTSNMPNYQFKATPEKYRSKGAGDTFNSPAVRRGWQKLDVEAQRAMLQRENVVDALKEMVSNGINEQNIVINEQEININNIMARKIIHVYESVNYKNKKKMEKMLNEDIDSFNKVLTFALRQ